MNKQQNEKDNQENSGDNQKVYESGKNQIESFDIHQTEEKNIEDIKKDDSEENNQENHNSNEENGNEENENEELSFEENVVSKKFTRQESVEGDKGNSEEMNQEEMEEVLEENIEEDSNKNVESIGEAEENEIDDLKNEKINYNVNKRGKGSIMNTNTIGEVSNENASSYSQNREENNSFVNKAKTFEEQSYDTIDRSGKNLESLDFIVIANKTIQHIHHINYSFNQIKSLDNSLFYLGFLITMDVSHNEIKKIQCLDNCVNLKYLNLSHNQISVLEGIYHLHQLEVLDISYNKITVSDIILKKLKFNKILKSLNLEGNAGYHFEELKYKVLELLESINILDNKEIFKQQRTKGKTKSTSDFKLFFKSGGRQEISNRPHNLRTIKEYIKFKKYFYEEEEKVKNNLK